MEKLEILAPAGGPEQLVAAVRCGADAVYLGTKGFNARQNATNFEGDGLGETVAYCHARNVKVLVTLNTLVTDGELPELKEAIRSVACAGADAVIVQDLATAALVKEICPDMPLHASTQMTLHNLAGVRQAQEMGFRRVVLARELTLEEIRRISEQTDVELECFVHGALCMSVSGACYLSAMLGGRSGNRGLCAQPCRLNFTSGKREYALSLKDLSYMDAIRELKDAGITSLKIEGRMKRPEYVAAAVSACVAAREGKPYDRELLEAVFSRSGFTDGYLRGVRTLNMFGVRRSEDKAASEKACTELTTLYRRENPRVPVEMRLEMQEGKESLLEISDGQNTLCIKGEIPQRAQKAPATEESVRRSLEKTGGTPFYLTKLTACLQEGLMLPGAQLNAMRRQGLEDLLEMRSRAAAKEVKEQPLPMIHPYAAPKTPRYCIRAHRAAQLEYLDTEKAARIILPLGEIEKNPALIERYGNALAAEIPQLVYGKDEEKILPALLSLKEKGLSAAAVENIGAIGWVKAAGLEVLGGHGLNVMNSLSLAEYEKLGLSEITVSFELALQKMWALGGNIPRGVIAYGYLPLMRLRCCPAQGAKGCGGCDGQPSLTDRKGIRFPIVCQNKRYSVLHNSVPLSLSGKRLEDMDFYTLYFTLESPEECRDVMEAFEKGQPPQGAFTTGLYYKNLQ